MRLTAISLAAVICLFTIFGSQSFAQSVGPRPNKTTQGDASPVNGPPADNSIEAVISEIELLRKSLHTLTARLGEISDRLPALDSKQGNASDKQIRVAPDMELLGRAEERSGILRKQLIELIEKETSYKSRLAQMDEEARPENVERSLSGVGTTRTAELREVRRRSLEVEKRGLESLVSLSAQSRARLEEDLKQAESLVSRIRQRLLPVIDRELEKIRP